MPKGSCDGVALKIGSDPPVPSEICSSHPDVLINILVGSGLSGTTLNSDAGMSFLNLPVCGLIAAPVGPN